MTSKTAMKLRFMVSDGGNEVIEDKAARKFSGEEEFCKAWPVRLLCLENPA